MKTDKQQTAKEKAMDYIIPKCECGVCDSLTGEDIKKAIDIALSEQQKQQDKICEDCWNSSDIAKSMKNQIDDLNIQLKTQQKQHEAKITKLKRESIEIMGNAVKQRDEQQRYEKYVIGTEE